MAGTGTGTSTGDPHLTTFTGVKFDLHGSPGSSYSLLTTAGLDVRATVRAFEDGKTVMNQVTIKTESHTAVIVYDSVLVDGAPPLEGHRRPGDWIWCQDQDKLVAVGHAGWLVSVFRQSGLEQHHEGGELQGVQHLDVYVNLPGFDYANPNAVLPVPSGTTGLLVDGDETDILI